MADHRAEDIIRAIVTQVTDLTTTGAHVVRGRAYPADDSELPALSVYMGAERPIEEQSIAFMDREIEVIIAAHVKETTSTIETTINAIKKEVYVAVMDGKNSDSLNFHYGLSYIHDIYWNGDSEPNPQDGSNKPTARCEMSFLIHYRTNLFDPSA